MGRIVRRQKLNYIKHGGKARGHYIITKIRETSSTENETGCWLFNGSKNTDGYGQVFLKKNLDLSKTGRAAQTAFLLHRLAFVAVHGQDITQHGSHICD